MSRKSERLVNLVIALLATKRNLTKSEIFRTIEGYDGSNEAMERMFERDKDELRSLGIDIEVSGIDPLFEDEQGYRIRSENFQMDTKGYSPIEISYMSIAAQIWKSSTFDEHSQRVLRKLSGFLVPLDIAELPSISPLSIKTPSFLGDVINAISEKRSMHFLYLDVQLRSNKRNIYPYSYFSHHGFWYFHGFDLDKREVRTFRCDRVQGEITVSAKAQIFEIPEGVEAYKNLNDDHSKFEATLRIRKGRGSQLRSLAVSSKPEEEHDLIVVEHVSENILASLILWHLDDVEVISPDSLRTQIKESLQKLVLTHG